MPQHRSAEKRMRTSAKRRVRNRAVRSELRQAIRSFRQAPLSDKAGLLPETVSLIDNAVRKGVLHQKTASRTKSRLAKLLNRSQEESAA